MATFTVTRAADVVDPNDGQLSLREAVAQANATTTADMIVFAGALEGATLVLSGGELTLSRDVTIDGDANNDGVEVALSGGGTDLTPTGGRVGDGANGGACSSAAAACPDRLARLPSGCAHGTIHGYIPENECPAHGATLEGMPMATFTVTTGADLVDPGDGKLSLREAVAQANATAAADTIRFAAALEGTTLVLTGGELVVRQDVRIDGDRDDDGTEVTLSGGDASRVLAVLGGGTDVTLRDLTLTEGHGPEDENGGAVLLAGGGLAMAGCTVSGSQTDNYEAGGGIFAGDGSRLTVTGSSIVGNNALFGTGGGIATGANVALTVRDSLLSGNEGYYGGGAISLDGGTLVMEDSTVSGNNAAGGGSGGGLSLAGTSRIARSTISDNAAYYSGGGIDFDGRLTLTDSTVAANRTGDNYGGSGGGIRALGDLVVRNSTITGNTVLGYAPYHARGGGIAAGPLAPLQLDIANSIVAGNTLVGTGATGDLDIFGAITLSNGHNVFGSDVAGNVAGDRENVAPSALFAALDPDTGGGQLDADGVVLLRDSAANPAVSGADSLLVQSVDQLGTARFQPATSRADIGAVEINQALSTTASARNDVLTGNANANTLSALAGNDKLVGLGGNDTLNGGDGSDLLDGGPGNDRLNGDDPLSGESGVDLAIYNTASTPVVVDLSGTVDTARRGSETDTLTGIEGALGSSAADTFRGDELANYFRGSAGKDTFTGGGGRDLYDFNVVGDSPAGTGRDLISDFAHLVDDIDLAGIDANTAVAGDQAFRFVGTAGLGTTPGAVGYFVSGGNTIVRASNDSDNTAELEIQLAGLVTPTADDFYL